MENSMQIKIDPVPPILRAESSWCYSRVTIIREPTDPKIYNESRLWYLIKEKLVSMGYDVIKKDRKSVV